MEVQREKTRPLRALSSLAVLNPHCRASPDLNSSTYMSSYSLVMVSLGIFPPSIVPGNIHSRARDMLRNAFFQQPIQCSTSHVLGRTEMCVKVTLPARAGRKMACWGIFCLVAVIWRSFCCLHSFQMNLHLLRVLGCPLVCLMLPISSTHR